MTVCMHQKNFHFDQDREGLLFPPWYIGINFGSNGGGQEGNVSSPILLVNTIECRGIHESENMPFTMIQIAKRVL